MTRSARCAYKLRAYEKKCVAEVGVVLVVVKAVVVVVVAMMLALVISIYTCEHV